MSWTLKARSRGQPRVSKRLEAKDGRSFVFVGFRIRRAVKVNGWRVFSTNNKYTAW